MARILIALIVVALSIYTLIDCARTPSATMPARIPKVAWLLLLFLVPVIGPLIWLYFRYQHIFSSDAKLSSGDIAQKMRGHRGKSGPVAPDDDPDFLARLEAQNRRRAYEQRKAEEKGEDSDKNTQSSPDESGDDTDEQKGLYS